MVRAKMVCIEKSVALQSAYEINNLANAQGISPADYLEKAGLVRVTLKPVFNGSEENLKFANVTLPDGECRMLLVNKAAAEAFEVGQAYYLDFSLA